MSNVNNKEGGFTLRTFKRPNVLLIYTDQQRKDTLSCYTDSPIQTNHIDSLAYDGVMFDQCYVQSPICGPSRMSFLTGCYCSNLGVGTNGIAFPDQTHQPVNQLLKPYGYETAQLGKIHFQPHAKRDHKDPYPTYEFDRFIVSDEPGCYDDAYTKWVEMIDPTQVSKVRTSLPPAAFHYKKPEYSTVPRETHEPYVFEGDDDLSHSAFVASETCRFLKERSKDKPFFAIAGFYAPHTPINPPQSCLDRVDVSKIKQPLKVALEQTMPILKDFTDEDYTEMIKSYLALTLHVDDCVGEILKTLKETNAYEDTIIIFTTDHGEYLGDYGRVQKGMPGYDCITNVPMIMRYPKGVSSPKVITSLVEAVDVVPTILDWCGIQKPSFIQGESLVPLLNGQKSTHKDSILVEHFTPLGFNESTIRTKQYKYYCNSSGSELLFDLEKDPKETLNMVNEEAYTHILSEMRKKLMLRIQKAAYRSLAQDAEY